MEPVFTLPYPEFCVAQQLARHFPARKGYSLHVPLSRQQPGFDIVLARGRGKRVQAARIQVRSSRIYSHSPVKSPVKGRAKLRFRYGTRFGNFKCSPEADFFCLFWLYPAESKTQRRDSGTWWSPRILLFPQSEMRQFLQSMKTPKGKKDAFFYFEFDKPGDAFLTRGDPKRRDPKWTPRSFTGHFLEARLNSLRRFLSV